MRTQYATAPQQAILLRDKFHRIIAEFTNWWKPFTAQTKPSPTVEELARCYLEDCHGKVKLSTCSTYETTVEKHILPEFGSLPITELSAGIVNQFLRQKAYPTNGPPLAVATVRSMVTVLRGILQLADNSGYCVFPFEYVYSPAGPDCEARTLSAVEQQRLKDYCCIDMDPVKLGVLICLHTGLRIGEICAMKWGDISFQTGTIKVSRTIQRIKNPEYRGGGGEQKTKVIFDAPKSKCANRHIPIPGCLREHLKQFQCEKDCFILTSKQDIWMEPRCLQRRFISMLKQVDIPRINFHALRHTFATNYVEQGFDIKTLSRILGHSNVSVTLNTYVHPSVSLMRSYMDRLG